jgi:hypothetical protein
MTPRDLEQAKIHVREGQLQIARQRALIAKLESDGHDVRQAQELMHALEKAQALHIAVLDNLRGQSKTQSGADSSENMEPDGRSGAAEE